MTIFILVKKQKTFSDVYVVNIFIGIYFYFSVI